MLVGCPIRKPADQLVCAHPRSLSQLVASFIASESLGIPRTPFSAFPAVNTRRCCRPAVFSLLARNPEKYSYSSFLLLFIFFQHVKERDLKECVSKSARQRVVTHNPSLVTTLKL